MTGTTRTAETGERGAEGTKMQSDTSWEGRSPKKVPGTGGQMAEKQPGTGNWQSWEDVGQTGGGGRTRGGLGLAAPGGTPPAKTGPGICSPGLSPRHSPGAAAPPGPQPRWPDPNPRGRGQWGDTGHSSACPASAFSTTGATSARDKSPLTPSLGPSLLGGPRLAPVTPSPPWEPGNSLGAER